MTILFVCFSYLLGSIPSGYLLYRITNKGDIRNFGSKNIGATNVLRTTGWKLAIPVAALDIFKGFLPAFLGLKLFDDSRWALVFGFCAIVGHCFPIFLGFKGGKGVATTAGVYAAIGFVPLLLMMAVFLIVIAITRYISLGSLLGVLSFPLFSYFFRGKTEILFLSAAVFLLIAFRHKGNIQRLIKGNERKIGEKVT
ncbi:MAG: glycerol-3-phosphate 1-O-acyltransferase PlsY [Candidatus Aminicenantes bacterium]|nr:glycerol-3-phosphate 1-O-acyltransferase PlsY [Candidatus Aminicenantes bacterium]